MKAKTPHEWSELPAVKTWAQDDLFKPLYLLAELEGETDDEQTRTVALPCSLVNFTARTVTVRFPPTTRDEFSLAIEYVTCAPHFLRWETPEETARLMMKRTFSYDDGY
jgi:hypothetical protein